MKIRELLTDEAKWTRGAYARNKENRATGTRNDDAVRWCLMGAKWKCYYDTDQHESVSGALEAEIGSGWNLTRWNDNATFADVKALVERLDV